MGNEINWERVALWGEGDDFLAFAFGDFDSKSAKIVRVSNGSRYSTQLSAPMQDITAEVPGGDG